MQQQLRSAVGPSIDIKIRDYVTKRGRYEDLKHQMEEAKLTMEAAKFELWDYLEAEDLKTVHHALGRVTRSVITRALVKDFESLLIELDDLGLRHAMTKTVIRQKELNALLKERMNQGDEPPAGTEPLLLRTITFAPAKPAADAMRAQTED